MIFIVIYSIFGAMLHLFIPPTHNGAFTKIMRCGKIRAKAYKPFEPSD
jgi:hypothetical protein